MSEHLVKLVFNVDHAGYSANEGASYSIEVATRLVATRVCRVDENEPNKEELAEAVRGYRKPRPARYWELPLVSRLGRETHRGFWAAE